MCFMGHNLCPHLIYRLQPIAHQPLPPHVPRLATSPAFSQPAAWACPRTATTALGSLLPNWRASPPRALTHQSVLGTGTPMGQCPHRFTHKAPPVLARARLALLCRPLCPRHYY
ncbi:hypothetical protein BOTBODRAFT_520352 [Botryobasidium botryosum FD-172 SS1]|uniref:Uncharacterized protein n=1 Tax=Botryobasidium botryosum (strain FD-172 SS1) TaxID=930990 RepID=A0A067M4Q8_BOTB1|nr:hypothetical protein BOTBODRAFT_520352 [Botryobasidium botryosum FD-172 SS1]